MKVFNLRFKAAAVEREYKEIKEKNMKGFFKLLIYIIILFSVLVFIQAIRTGSLAGFIRTAVILVVSLILLKFGYKLKRYLDYVLGALGLAFFLFGVIYVGQSIAPLKPPFSLFVIGIFNTGYFYGVFERLIILEITRVELKIVFSIASLVTRLVIWNTTSAVFDCFQVLFWIICIFVDIRREKNDRLIFKGFYDFREEILKFKNLMVSGLPTNILILSKDFKKQLFINEHFQSTFSIGVDDELWEPREWLASNRIEKDSVHIPSLRDEIYPNIDLEEFLHILKETDYLVQGQSVSFNTKIKMFDTDTSSVFEAKVLSLMWAGQDAIVIMMNDVTEQYTNLGLKVADANKDKMIAMVSHELRNPLNGILGMIYIMEKRIEDSEVLKYLSVCKNSGKLLLNLVNSILDLGQIRNNKFKLNISRGNLSELLQETYLLFEFQFKQKNLTLKLETEPDVPEFIVTDLIRLRQVLINLIANALKFTFEGGVCVSVARDEVCEGNVLFKVSDTGIGIKEEEKKKLFKMYGRLDQSDKTINHEGVGLGLTISNHLVRLLACDEEHKAIQVETTFGTGTTFIFSIKANLDLSPALLALKDTEIEDKDYSVCDEGYIDMRPKISCHILQSQSSSKLLLIPKSPLNAKRNPSTFYEQEKDERDPLRLVSCQTDNDDEFMIKAPRLKGEALLVDDNPFNLMVAKNMIEALGYRVKTALNGKIAVDMVKEAADGKNAFDIVFMDCQMPVMDGFEATSIIRRLMKEKNIPELSIIALSANDSEDDKKRCLEVGMDDHIAKPLSEPRLKIALNKYQERRSQL